MRWIIQRDYVEFFFFILHLISIILLKYVNWETSINLATSTHTSFVSNENKTSESLPNSIEDQSLQISTKLLKWNPGDIIFLVAFSFAFIYSVYSKIYDVVNEHVMGRRTNQNEINRNNTLDKCEDGEIKIGGSNETETLQFFEKNPQFFEKYDPFLLALTLLHVIYYTARFIDYHYLDRTQEDMLNIIRVIYMIFVILSFSIEVMIFEKLYAFISVSCGINQAIVAIDIAYLYESSKHPNFWIDLLHLVIRMASIYLIYMLNELLIEKRMMENERNSNMEKFLMNPRNERKLINIHVKQRFYSACTMLHVSILYSLFSPINPFRNTQIHTSLSQHATSMSTLNILFGLCLVITAVLIYYVCYEKPINRRFYVVKISRCVNIIVGCVLFWYSDQLSMEGIIKMMEERYVLACILYSLIVICTASYNFQSLDYFESHAHVENKEIYILSLVLGNILTWYSFYVFQETTVEVNIILLVLLDLKGIYDFCMLEKIRVRIVELGMYRYGDVELAVDAPKNTRSLNISTTLNPKIFTPPDQLQPRVL